MHLALALASLPCYLVMKRAFILQTHTLHHLSNFFHFLISNSGTCSRCESMLQAPRLCRLPAPPCIYRHYSILLPPLPLQPLSRVHTHAPSFWEDEDMARRGGSS